MTAIQSFTIRRIITQPAHMQQPYARSHITNGLTTLRGVRQDKAHPQRDRIATPQPAPPKNIMRPHQMNTNSSRSQKQINKRKTVHLSLWVKPSIKAELQRIAAQEGLSISATGGAALAEWIRQQLHIQHAVLLQPIIETTIRKEISRIITRQVLFQVRLAFEAGQTRRIVTNILKLQNGVTSEKLYDIIDKSAEETRKHLFRRTPEIASLLTEVETWMREEKT